MAVVVGVSVGELNKCYFSETSLLSCVGLAEFRASAQREKGGRTEISDRFCFRMIQTLNILMTGYGSRFWCSGEN